MAFETALLTYLSAIFPKWRTLKPEIDGNSEHVELSPKFQRLPHIFHHDRVSEVTVDIADMADYLTSTWRTLNRK